MLGLPPGSTELKQLGVPELKALAKRLLPEAVDNIDEDLKKAAVALLEGQSVHTVADLIQSPGAIEQLVTFLKGGWQSLKTPTSGPVTDVVQRGFYTCKVCDFVNFAEYRESELPKGFACVHCSDIHVIS